MRNNASQTDVRQVFFKQKNDTLLQVYDSVYDKCNPYQIILFRQEKGAGRLPKGGRRQVKRARPLFPIFFCLFH